MDIKIADQFLYSVNSGQLKYIRAQWVGPYEEFTVEGRIDISAQRMAHECRHWLDAPELAEEFESFVHAGQQTRDRWDAWVIKLQKAAEARGFVIRPDYESGDLVFERVED